MFFFVTKGVSHEDNMVELENTLTDGEKAAFQEIKKGLRATLQAAANRIQSVLFSSTTFLNCCAMFFKLFV